jgi:hypothetical protein
MEARIRQMANEPWFEVKNNNKGTVQYIVVSGGCDNKEA